MQETMKCLCENIQGCVFGYTQSDEITLILIDYKELTSDAFFDYNVQKLCSIIASMATLKFNMFFSNKVLECYDNYADIWGNTPKLNLNYLETLRAAADKGAMFDTRVFNIPKEEIANLIYWRQLDSMRNSIQMCGQAEFSQKQLQGISCKDIKELLKTYKGFDWDNDLEEYKQRGTACFKIETSHLHIDMKTITQETRLETTWLLDKEMPIIKGEDRTYVERHIYT